MLGILTILSLGMSDKFSMLFLTKRKENQEFKILINYIFIGFVFLMVSFFSYGTFDFSFLFDFKFYIALSLENIRLYISIKNYNKQKNFAQVAFSGFSSIYLIILIGYLYPLLFDISIPISSPYKTITEVIFFSSLFFILTIVYFYDKLKNKDINHPLDLFLHAIFLVNTLYFAILMFQTYQPFLVYTPIFISLALQQLFWIHKRYKLKEFKTRFLMKNITKKDRKFEIKNTLFYLFLHLLSFILTIVAGRLISVEFFALFKRTGAIFSSYIIDTFFLEKKTKTQVKDMIVLGVIFSIGLFLYYR